MGVVSGVMGAKGASKAARKLRDNIRLQREYLTSGYDQSRVFRQSATDIIGGLQAEDPRAAADMLRAFSGSMGQGAQREAYQGFQDSPGVSFLRERGLRGIDRRSAAMGGLGGGNRLKALTQFSQGMALQDFQRQMAMLGGVADMDMGLAGQMAGRFDLEADELMQHKRDLSNMIGGSSVAQANVIQNRYNALGGIGTGALGDIQDTLTIGTTIAAMFKDEEGGGGGEGG